VLAESEGAAAAGGERDALLAEVAAMEAANMKLR
jgi:hypothetical protein